jgi:hypothetical protein
VSWATARMPSPHPRDGWPPARPARCPIPPGRATNGGLRPVTLSTGPGEGAQAAPGPGPVPISTDPVPARRRSPPGRGNQAQETENRKTTGQPSIVGPGPTTGPRTGPRPGADTGSDQTVPGRGGHRLGTDDGPSRPVTGTKTPIAPGQRPGAVVARGGVEPPTFRFSDQRSGVMGCFSLFSGASESVMGGLVLDGASRAISSGTTVSPLNWLAPSGNPWGTPCRQSSGVNARDARGGSGQ